MPRVASEFVPSMPFKNRHFATIYSAKLRKAPIILQHRERLQLPDNDFLDLDFSFSKAPTQKIALLLHGLEGNAQRSYIKGQACAFLERGWDVCAMNYRGCSGEPNKKYLSYNAGKTDDLNRVVHYLLEKDRYKEIALVGFSLGGNLLLKYLGEGNALPKSIKKTVAISSPLDLKGSLYELSQWYNWVYRTAFLYDFRMKLRLKMKQYPERMTPAILKQITSLKAFDDLYTAPAHGFKDAEDYYAQNSSLQFLPNISIPVLILNARNDSFLSKNCYPFSLAEKSKILYLETPKYGGHVGFHKTDRIYYSEARTLQFLTSNS